MNVWDIKVLYFGKIAIPKSALTPNFDENLVLDVPYLGFLLQKEKRNIVVDTGISEKFFVDGTAWGGFPAEGGRAYLEKALADANVSPLDIETVIYTHLHNDHAANCSLFKNARIIFQRDEWKNLVDPLPAQKLRKDYDPGLVQELSSMNGLKVDGDLELTEGIKLYKTPGHSLGSQSVAVSTKKGIVVLVGDQFHLYCNAFPYQTELMDMKGQKHKITPAPEIYGPSIPSSLTYDFFDYYDSIYKIKAIASADQPGFIIAGHEPSLVFTGI